MPSLSEQNRCGGIGAPLVKNAKTSRSPAMLETPEQLFKLIFINSFFCNLLQTLWRFS